jgi:hypothetical protein
MNNTTHLPLTPLFQEDYFIYNELLSIIGIESIGIVIILI